MIAGARSLEVRPPAAAPLWGLDLGWMQPRAADSPKASGGRFVSGLEEGARGHVRGGV